MNLPVSEVFLAHQGEGPFSGRLSLFVRLMGCPVQCSWCDTPYTWKPEHLDKVKKISVGDILNAADVDGVRYAKNMVITGGEPLIHQTNTAFRDLTNAFVSTRSGATVEIETSGIRMPTLERSWLKYRVSIKLPSAKVNKQFADYIGIYCRWQSSEVEPVYKWVVDTEEDEDAVRAILDISSSNRENHWLMPQAQTASELIEKAPRIQALAMKLGCNYSHRTHVALFSDKRGV